MLTLAQCAGGLTASGIILQRATARHLAAASLPTTLLRQKQTMKSSTLQICVGNEAGDLDSIVSAIATSFLKNALHQHNTSSSTSSTTTTTTCAIPLIPFPRSEFRLRRDAVYLFSLVGFQFDEISESPIELIFSDELDQALQKCDPASSSSSSSGSCSSEAASLELVLTDHNKRTIQHTALDDAIVVEIIDHHADSGDHPNVVGSQRNVVGGALSFFFFCFFMSPLLFSHTDFSSFFPSFSFFPFLFLFRRTCICVYACHRVTPSKRCRHPSRTKSFTSSNHYLRC